MKCNNCGESKTPMASHSCHLRIADSSFLVGHYSRGCTNEKPAEEEETNDEYPSVTSIPAVSAPAVSAPAFDAPAWGSAAAVVVDEGW